MKFINENIADKIEQFYTSDKIVATNFLDPSEVVSVLGDVRGVNHVIWGGFEAAERKMILIGADFEDEFTDEFRIGFVDNVSSSINNIASEYVGAIRVSLNPKNLTGTLSHRSVLGSILGLGVKREMIGDIIVQDNLCDIIVSKNILEFLLANLNSVGRNKVTVKEISLNDISAPKDTSEEIKTTVSSLRVDSVISAGYGISREKSVALVKGDFVKVNHTPVKSAVKLVHQGDLISVRGKGRLEVREVGGTSKSGRIKLAIARK